MYYLIEIASDEDEFVVYDTRDLNVSGKNCDEFIEKVMLDASKRLSCEVLDLYIRDLHSYTDGNKNGKTICFKCIGKLDRPTTIFEDLYCVYNIVYDCEYSGDSDEFFEYCSIYGYDHNTLEKFIDERCYKRNDFFDLCGGYL